MNQLPSLFLERLQQIIPADLYPSVIQTFTRDKILSVRLNTLREKRENIRTLLKERAIEFQDVEWYKDALVITTANPLLDDLIQKGFLYRQNLSSMLVPLVLNPQPGERVLDLCAAPGSKTTQMAAMMNNEGQIIANEPIKSRFYKLKSVVSLLGADSVEFKVVDGRKFRDAEFFDKILVDAPCSSEGLFQTSTPETYGYWSPRKIKEMVQKQRGLLLNATRLLKKGGTLVYSTCTFSPEENEGVVDWVLRKTKENLKIVPVELQNIKVYSSLVCWQNKTFSDEIQKCARILPADRMNGFFIAKIQKD